ncbi:hypothetical protein AGMMS50268_32460 [Spirochaetia bacterium]|nr:hypothetical protein AGMMS50268_32460 [Spirochaetia bacterium]
MTVSRPVAPGAAGRAWDMPLHSVSFVVLLLGLLFLASCATVPKTTLQPPDAAGTEYFPLAPGALVYVYADVDAARPLLDHFSLGGVSGSQAADILDRTRYAVAAVYPEAPAKPEGDQNLPAQNVQNVQAAAWGNYPSARAQFAFTFSKDWKKRRSATGKSYWYSDRNGLSVALNAGQAFVSLAAPGLVPGDAAANLKNPLDPFAPSPGTPSPEGFAEFRRGAALALWVENPAVPLNRFLSDMKLPLQIPAEQLLISLLPAVQAGPEPTAASPADPGSAGYEARIRIKTPTATQARGLVTLFSMARLFVTNAAGAGGAAALLPVLFANPPVQEGAFLNIRTATLDAGDIALLFSQFSSFSR